MLDFQSVRRVILQLTLIWCPSKSVKRGNIQQIPCQEAKSTLQTLILGKYLLILEISWQKCLILFKSWLLYYKFQHDKISINKEVCFAHGSHCQTSNCGAGFPNEQLQRYVLHVWAISTWRNVHSQSYLIYIDHFKKNSTKNCLGKILRVLWLLFPEFSDLKSCYFTI